MTASSFQPMLALLAQIGREPAAPLRLWLRHTSHLLRPPRPLTHAPFVRRRQHAVLATGRVGPQHHAQILAERGSGPLPTIVIGGFVPDAPEAVYLLRGDLLRQGSVYYFNFPRRGFSSELCLAQLGDLVEEVTAIHRRRPVIFAISFGAGLVIDWLRRQPGAATLSGLVLISPVAGVDDLLDPAAPKPTTLLGRVVKPYLDAGAHVTDAVVEKSRAVFLKMFESGAQNRDAWRLLLTPGETARLRRIVLGTINGIEPAGAAARVRALRDFLPLARPTALSTAPTLILFAEKEDAVLREGAPGAATLQAHATGWFPQGRCQTITNDSGPPVQHASLIFHSRNFQPPIAAFYRALRQRARAAA